MVPVASVTAGLGPLIIELAGVGARLLVCARMICLPGVGLPFTSVSVIVIVACETPSSGTLPGAVWSRADIAGGVMNGSWAVWVSWMPSVVSVAVKVTSSAV